MARVKHAIDVSRLKKHTVHQPIVWRSAPVPPPEWRRPASLTVWHGRAPDRSGELLLAVPHFNAACALLRMDGWNFHRCNFVITPNVELIDFATAFAGHVLFKPNNDTSWRRIDARYDLRP